MGLAQTPPIACPDAVLFDFDGTLAELTIDFGEMRQRVYEVLETFGVPRNALQARYVLELIDEGAEYLSGRHDNSASFHAAAHAAIQEVELSAAAAGGLISGAKPALDWLVQEGIPFGIVTRNCRLAVNDILTRSGIRCPVLLTRDDVPHVKPDPRHLGAALGQLGREPARSVMVGDHPMDMQTASAVGMTGMGVLTGGTSRESLLGAGAVSVLSSVADLPCALDSEGGVL